MSEHHERDDLALLTDFIATGSEAAFTELVRRNLPLVFQVALRRLGSAALAEEAAQHAFACLATKASAVARHPERLKAWLHRTAYFEASTLARKETRLSRVPVIPEPDPEPMNRPELYDRLDEALNRLPELDRELVLRHCCEGEDYRLMAVAVGKSEAACQKRVERALAKLGQGLGGARTAGAVVAAFSATNLKGQALPNAERMATAALKLHTASSSVASAISGMKLAACAALALAGGAAGWQREDPSPAPPAAVRSTPSRSIPTPTKSIAKTGDIVLAPHPVSLTRSRDEVLESIQAGRLGPLIEFLPNATVPDLRAIMAEDDLGDLAEGLGSFETAHSLAVLRWAELDPAGAFQYGRFRSMSITSAALGKWMEADPAAAAAACLALSPLERRELAETLVRTNDSAAEKLAALDPGLDWTVEENRALYPDPEADLESAERLVEQVLSGKRRDEPTGKEANEIQAAFFKLDEKDHETAVSRAKLLPWPELRNRVLAGLYQYHPPSPDSLKPGPLRTLALASEAEKLMETEPETAIRKLQAATPGAERDAIYQAVSNSLAGRDPWRLLTLVSTLSGSLQGGKSELDRALLFAGKSDPERALALLPELSIRVGRARDLAGKIVSGWVEKDPAAAIQWAGMAGIRLDTDDLEKVQGNTKPLLKLLTMEDKTANWMVQSILLHQVEEGLADGSAKDLLDQMPQKSADNILWRLATREASMGGFDEALRLAKMASPDAQGKLILPQMGMFALRNDPVRAVKWLQSLPAADLRAVVTGIELFLSEQNYGDETQLREALQQLKP